MAFDGLSWLYDVDVGIGGGAKGDGCCVLGRRGRRDKARRYLFSRIFALNPLHIPAVLPSTSSLPKD